MTVDTLPDDPGTLKAMLLAERARAERLEQIIKELQRHRFGRRAETLPEDQLLLGLEDVEQVAASKECEGEAAAPAARNRSCARWRKLWITLLTCLASMTSRRLLVGQLGPSSQKEMLRLFGYLCLRYWNSKALQNGLSNPTVCAAFVGSP